MGDGRGKKPGWTRRVTLVTFPSNSPLPTPLRGSMDLLTLRAAAGGGSVDGFDTAQLVAAGFTLLQRSAALVRALAGRRAAILVPTSPQFLVALAAADGRGAVLLDPLAAPTEIAHQLRDADVGAVFTVASLAMRLPAIFPHVLLDEAPTTATVVTALGTARIDLGSHFGLALEGAADLPGRDEECTICYRATSAGAPVVTTSTHRDLIAGSRRAAEAAAITRADHLLLAVPFDDTAALAWTTAALMTGARVTTMPRFDPLAAVEAIARGGITLFVGSPAMFDGILPHLAPSSVLRHGGPLRAGLCNSEPPTADQRERWAAATGGELRTQDPL